MTSQTLRDLMEEYAVVSTEVEAGRLASDAPRVRALADRMAAAMTETTPLPPKRNPAPA